MSILQKIIEKIESRRNKKRLALPGPEGDFWRQGGNEILFNKLPVKTGSVVIDAGAYRGEWSAGMIMRYGCRVIMFEPIPKYSDDLKLFYSKNSNVKVINAALGSKDEITYISSQQDSSSIYKSFKDSQSVKVSVVDVARQFLELQLDDISCLKLNIEGSEYGVLERLMEKGLINPCLSILIQFHRYPSGYEERYKKITENLMITHVLQWKYSYVWELWIKK
jgi:FkbM family methyltransferase